MMDMTSPKENLSWIEAVQYWQRRDDLPTLSCIYCGGTMFAWVSSPSSIPGLICPDCGRTQEGTIDRVLEEYQAKKMADEL